MFDTCMFVMIKHATHSTSTVQPGQPRNLTHDPQTLTSTGVLLQWNPPHTVGVPSFLSYIITITSNGDEASKHTTNTSYFTLEDLHPGTSYNVSVSAVSDVFPEGGDKSETISFMTDTAGRVNLISDRCGSLITFCL